MTDGLVPTIDLSSPTHEAARALDEACCGLGFFQVEGHGIADTVTDALAAAIDSFFSLPLDEKLRWVPSEPGVDRGYAPEGSEALAYSIGLERPPDLFEAFNIGPDVVDLTDEAVAACPFPFFAPNRWPDTLPAFRAALVRYYDEAEQLAARLCELAAVALDLPACFFADKIDHSTNVLRTVNYERRPGQPDARPGQMRMGPHTDYGIFTVLWADAVPGLQIVGPDGQWHDVLPRRGALLVNVGDLTATWTNDRWHSTIHRVVPPPAGSDGSARRRSAAFFFDGNYDALIECLPSCASADNPPRYPAVLAGDHLMGKLLGPRVFSPSEATSTAGARTGAV